MLSFPSVFRNGDIILLGNDPYYYRYWVDQVVAEAGMFDFSAFAALPSGVTKGEPLLVATLWFMSSLLGGSTGVIGLVIAWYPVVAAMLTGVFLYLTATTVSGDRRIGLATVLMLALIPVNAYRTGLGFADHHAFDYLWLALTALALVKLVSETDRSWPYSVVLGVAVTGQLLAWDNGALLVVPLALVISLYAALELRRDRSPLREGAPLIAGLALASMLVWGAHTTLGWHSTVVASVPTLLFGGSAVIFALAEGARRVGLSAKTLLGAEAVAGVGLLVVLPSVFPELSQGLDRGLDTLFVSREIVETTSLVSGEMGTLVGPLLLLGFVFALGLPYVGWATLRAIRRRDAQWLALAVYAWWFLALSFVQLRFAGEFSVFLALFAGVGFVHLASVVDLTNPVGLFDDTTASQSRPRGRANGGEQMDLQLPSRREAMSYLGFTALVGSLSFVQIPVKFSQLTVADQEYRTAAWMREYADEKGWSYPQTYVLSSWGMNRMYNYIVNGESKSYAYARNNYDSLLRANDPAAWYERLRDRVGFVVTSDEAAGGTMAAQLANYGSESEGRDALSHYRLVHTEGSLRVFTLVAGATLTGEADGESVTASVDVDVGGETFTYEQTVDVGSDGTFSVTVPYTGEYDVAGGTYVVDEAAVTEGTDVRVRRGEE
ncbi:STT3 domain-containing protein [Halogranum amylolyticum]|nr:STT3 domain-containing protein [Halogranum amylolyticum]